MSFLVARLEDGEIAMMPVWITSSLRRKGSRFQSEGCRGPFHLPPAGPILICID